MGTWHWDDAYKRLEQAGRMIDTILAPPPERVQQIFRERAATLARPLEENAQPQDLLEILVLPVGDERYGVEVDHVLEVAPLRSLIQLPGTPATIAGIANWKGRMLAVVDLGAFFRLTGRSHDQGRQMVVVEAKPFVFCLLATGPTGTIMAAGGSAPPSWESGERTPYLKLLTADMLPVLDIEILARAPEITINQEVV